jgi:putative ATPase
LLNLNPLGDKDIEEVIGRALIDPRGLPKSSIDDPKVLEQIIRLAGGDARRALTILEAAAMSSDTKPSKGKKRPSISLDDVATSMDRALVRYDRDGDQHYDVISAFIKSVRGSDADAAIHYLARMIEAGEDPRFIARRLMILAAEDIGLADPTALSLAVAAAETVSMIGMPEGRIPLAEATIYLALAPKSNSAYNAINAALDDVRAGNFGAVPDPLKSSNYTGAKARGAGIGYLYPHDDSRSVLEQRYLDEKLADRRYYLPKEIGAERELSERWPKLRAIIRSFKK